MGAVGAREGPGHQVLASGLAVRAWRDRRAAPSAVSGADASSPHPAVAAGAAGAPARSPFAVAAGAAALRWWAPCRGGGFGAAAVAGSCRRRVERRSATPRSFRVHRSRPGRPQRSRSRRRRRGRSASDAGSHRCRSRPPSGRRRGQTATPRPNPACPCNAAAPDSRCPATCSPWGKTRPGASVDPGPADHRVGWRRRRSAAAPPRPPAGHPTTRSPPPP